MIALITAALQSFIEACQTLKALLPYLKERDIEKDEDLVQELLSRHTPADALHASVVSERIKRKRGTEPQRPA